MSISLESSFRRVSLCHCTWAMRLIMRLEHTATASCTVGCDDESNRMSS